MNVVNFFSYLSQDIGTLCRGSIKDPDERKDLIFSVALRVIGALEMLMATALLFSGIVLAASSPIGLVIGIGIARVVGAILVGVVAYDVIQIGQNNEPSMRAKGFEMCSEFGSNSPFNGTILARYFFADDDSCLIS